MPQARSITQSKLSDSLDSGASHGVSARMPKASTPRPSTPRSSTPRSSPHASPKASPKASPSREAMKSGGSGSMASRPEWDASGTRSASMRVTPCASPAGTPRSIRAASEVKPRTLRGVSARQVASHASHPSPSGSPCASPSGGSTPRTVRTAPSFGGTPRSRPESNVELLWGSSGDATTEGSRTPHRVKRTLSATSLSSSVPSAKSAVGRANSTASRKQAPSIPLVFVTLRDVCSGETQRLSSDYPDWEAFFDSLTTWMREEVMSHLKSCGKCRAVSSFSRCKSRFQFQPISESSLGTVCQGCLQSLDAGLIAELQKQKDTLLTEMADALGMPLRDLLCFEGVMLQRQDARLASLPIVASERDRVLSQTHLRQSTRHIWVEYLDGKELLRAWGLAQKGMFFGCRQLTLD